jgi:RecB family exonuclease
MAKVSYSQYSKWSGCPQQYKLSYIDKLSESTSNIHLVFGTATHEVLQEYLKECFTTSKSKADKNMNLTELLKEKMRALYLKESNNGEIPICTKEELVEFLDDGNTILDYFQKSKNFNNFFSLKYDELVAIEHQVDVQVTPSINFVGYIDMVMKNTQNGMYRIIDFKTSTKGWSKYQKTDPVKNAQILLYKKFYSEILGIPEDMIEVEFIILKRKVADNTEYTIPRISRHAPANGKISVNKAWSGFKEFTDSVFDSGGNYRLDIQYVKKPSKLCNWCEFYERKICDGKL